MTKRFSETSETAILARKSKKNTTTLVAIARTTEIVATIVARQLLTTVRGGNQPSGIERNQA